MNKQAGAQGVTIKSAAEILNRSVSTLRNWDKTGKLKARRTKNGYRVYDIGTLERFAQKHNLKRLRHQKIKLIA